MILWFMDCPPITTTESAPTYHLDEGSLGYALEQEREERARQIKGTAAGIMRSAGIPPESAIAIADKAKGYADDLRRDIEGLARDESKPWELSPHRAMKAADACSDIVDKVVKRAGE